MGPRPSTLVRRGPRALSRARGSETPIGRRIRRPLTDYEPPLILWVIVVIGLLTLTVANGFDPLRAATWAHWDSGHYLFVASHGYFIFHCPSGMHHPAGGWCGDAGWFPAYPWLLGGLHIFGLPIGPTGVVVSWLFALGTLLLLWGTFLRQTLDAAAIGCLVFAAFVPGQIYHYAVSPVSMLAFFTVLHLWLLDRRQWLRAGLAGALAAMSYPVAVMLVPVSALWIAFALRDTPWPERIRRMFASTGAIVAGILVVLVDMQLETGHWDAYLKVQAKYAHGLHEPLTGLRTAIEPALQGSPLRLHAAPALLTIFVTVVIGCVAVEAALHWRGLRARDVLLLVWAAFFFLFPLTQAGVHLIRSQAALLPLGLLLGRLPRPLMFLIAGVALCLTIPIARLFLIGGLG